MLIYSWSFMMTRNKVDVAASPKGLMFKTVSIKSFSSRSASVRKYRRERRGRERDCFEQMIDEVVPVEGGRKTTLSGEPRRINLNYMEIKVNLWIVSPRGLSRYFSLFFSPRTSVYSNIYNSISVLGCVQVSCRVRAVEFKFKIHL